MKKDNNKYIFIAVGSIVLLIILIIILRTTNIITRYSFSRLKGDVVDSSVGRITISCDDNTLTVGQTTNCTLDGYLNEPIRTVSGILKSNSNLEISNVVKASDVWIMANPGLVIEYVSSDNIPAGDFNIATFKAKALSAGSGQITLTRREDNDTEVNIGTAGPAFSSIQVAEPIYGITVTNSSSGSSSSGSGGSSSSTTGADNKLSSLSVSSGVLSPAFDEDIEDYNVEVDNSVSSVTITATPDNSSATVTGTGAVNLTEGQTVTKNIDVTTGSGTRTYKVSIKRMGAADTRSSDNKLKSLSITNVTLDPVFSSDVIEYSSQVKNEVSKVTVSAETNDTKATLEGVGEKTLKEGKNTIEIKVTAENGYSKTYVVYITRLTVDGKIPDTPSSDSSDTACTLTSDIYKIDNDKQTINGVDKNHSDVTIFNNIRPTCGTITVANEKVTFKYDGGVKEYSIKRVFIAQTGQNFVKYALIIGGFLLLVGVAIFIKIKVIDKKLD